MILLIKIVMCGKPTVELVRKCAKDLKVRPFDGIRPTRTHPGGNPRANLKSISKSCHPILVAFVWDSTEETIDLPRGSPVRRYPPHHDLDPAILSEKGIKLKLSGNEVYYTACSLLVIFKNSCSKLHRQKVSALPARSSTRVPRL